MKKRLLLIASLPLIIAVALGVLATLPPSPGVTKANFGRIQEGMPLAEVQGIFGYEGSTDGTDEHTTHGCWFAKDGSFASVGFMNDCVAGKRWQDSDETIPDKIRRWLHLR